MGFNVGHRRWQGLLAFGCAAAMAACGSPGEELAVDGEPTGRMVEEIEVLSSGAWLEVEDIDLVESVQRGMETPAFTQGRIVNDPSGSGLSEHAVHHFHGLVLDAYERAGASA